MHVLQTIRPKAGRRSLLGEDVLQPEALDVIDEVCRMNCTMAVSAKQGEFPWSDVANLIQS